MQTMMVAATALVIIWISPLPHPVSGPRLVSITVRCAVAACVMLLGGVVGWNAQRRASARLRDHWLAWCMQERHRSNERRLYGMFSWLRGAFVVGCMVAFASHLIAISGCDLALAVAAFTIGFVLAFVVTKRHSHPSGVSVDERGSTRCVPATVLLQASRPGLVITCAGVAMLAVAIVAAWAVRSGNANLLGIALLLALIGIAFCQGFLVAGAAALHALLEWTGVTPWRAASRLLLLPVTSAVGIIAPIMIAGAVLQRPLWSMVALSIPAMVGYGAMVWVVSDLVRLRGGGAAFRIVNSLLPFVALGTGPLAALVLPLHLGWLIRRGHRAWREGT